MAGLQGRMSTTDAFAKPVAKAPSVFDAYGSSVATQGADYDRIMKGYQDQGARPDVAPISYQGSPDVTNALAMFKNFSETGGFSGDDIKSLRERSISPIRSIYANAKMNLDRNKTIQGGYSPGYAGASVKMARDLSNKVSTASNDANAGLAQMVQQGKLAAMSPYANLASSEAGRGLDVSKFNAGLEGDNRNRQLDVLKSQTGLYGTSPGMVGTLGNQALGSANLNENARQFDMGRVDRNTLAKLAAAGRF